MFPKRLYDMLENAEKNGYAHLISWMPDGKSFRIHAIHKKQETNDEVDTDTDEQAFINVLKQHFGQTKLKSFLRQLQIYGFGHSFRSGPHRGLCKHTYFVRGKRDILDDKSIEDFKQKSTRIRGFIVKSEEGTLKTAKRRPKYPSKMGATFLTNLVLPSRGNESESEDSTDANADDEDLSQLGKDVIPVGSSEDETKVWNELERKILGNIA